ncbi:VQ motif-containing protein 4-like [Ananas comosus]|uniref:VQ motif-containing protein 4-like n=1 Tax=Ananas comosus TaxID=4615 RepID=A0A6P5GDI1_ANACO|nr:VQ motif-containing protein 4-like [Ananas comosus]
MQNQVSNGRECSNPHPQPASPNASSPSSSSSSSSTSAGANNGVLAPSLTLRPPPRPVETAPSTTFVQADPSSFKQVVQMLTGSPSSSAPPPQPPSAARAAVAPKKPAFKLYERRGGGGLKSLKTIGPLPAPALRSPNPNPSPNPSSPWGQSDVPSPSMLGFRALTLSPVTPLSPDGVFNRSPRPGPPDSFAADAAAAAAAEERAIAEKGFYLHPSPRGAAAAAEPPPRLLPLFPVTSSQLSSSP